MPHQRKQMTYLWWRRRFRLRTAFFLTFSRSRLRSEPRPGYPLGRDRVGRGFLEIRDRICEAEYLGLQRAQRVAYDDALPAQVDQGKVVRLRSEERRVGKEC